MAFSQRSAVTRKRRRGTQAYGIEARARFLPQIYAQQEQTTRSDAAFAENKRQFGIQQGVQKEQFGEQMDLAKEVRQDRRSEASKAERIGALTLGVQGGMMAMQGQRMMEGRPKSMPRNQYQRESTRGQYQEGSSSSGTTWNERAAWGSGGIGGGMFGAGIAKAAGSKKRWQTAIAGAVGGMASTWMAGGTGMSIGLGGLLGGGIGALYA
jgi:hypothetical protein